MCAVSSTAERVCTRRSGRNTIDDWVNAVRTVAFTRLQWPIWRFNFRWRATSFSDLTQYLLRGFSYSEVSQEGKYRLIDDLTVLQLKTLLWNGLNSCRQQHRFLEIWELSCVDQINKKEDVNITDCGQWKDKTHKRNTVTAEEKGSKTCGRRNVYFLYIKVKQSRCRPGVAHRVPGS